MKTRWIFVFSLFFLSITSVAMAATSQIWIYQNGTSFVSLPKSVSAGASTLTLSNLSPSIDVSSVLVSPNQPIESVRLTSSDDQKINHLKINFLNRLSTTQTLTVSYLMHGLTWSPSHTLQLTKSGQSILTSWATLVNNTGARIEPSRISLIEGRVSSGGMMPRGNLMMATAKESSDGLPSDDAGYYRVYEVGSSISINKGESLRVQLLTPFQSAGSQTLVSRNYVGAYRNTQPQKASLAIQVNLDQSVQESLPAGPVQVFQETDTGMMWVGSSSLANLLPGKKISMTIGQPVDVEVMRTQFNYADTSAETKARYTYKIQNSRKEAITINFTENFSSTWTITGSSQPYQKVDASSASFSVTVPAGQIVSVWYDVTLQKNK